MASMQKKLLISSVFRIFEALVVISVSLLMTPYLISVFGNEDYGLWVLTLSILGWFDVLSLGFPTAVQRRINIELESRRPDKVNRVFSTSIVLFASLGLLCALMLVVLAFHPQWLGLSDDSQNTIGVCLMLLSIKVFWDFSMNAFFGFFSAMLRMDIDAKISTFNNIFSSLLVYFLIPHWHLLGAVAAVLLSNGVTNLLKIFYAKRLFPQLKFSVAFVSFAELKSLFGFSKHVIASGIARTINEKVDPILISHIFDLASVAVFSIANRLCAIVSQLGASVTGIFTPVFTKLMVRGVDMGHMFRMTTSINLFVAVSLLLPLVIMSESFIVLWVGEEFRFASPLAMVLVFALLFRTYATGIISILLAQANHKLLSVINLFAAIINISLSIILGQKYGLIGVAIGTSSSALLSDVLLKSLLLKRYNSISLRQSMLRLGFSCLLLISAVVYAQDIVAMLLPATWLGFIINSAGVFILSVLIGFVFVLDAEVKSKVSIGIKARLAKRIG